MDLLAEIQAALAAAKAVPRTAPFAEKVEGMLNKLGEVAMHMGANAMSDKVLTAFAFAHPFLEVCGDIVMAWMLLWRAVSRRKTRRRRQGERRSFLRRPDQSVEFFTHTILPVTFGKMKAILNANSAIVDIPEDAFGGIDRPDEKRRGAVSPAEAPRRKAGSAPPPPLFGIGIHAIRQPSEGVGLCRISRRRLLAGRQRSLNAA